MVVFCKVQICPYHSKNGFCKKRVLPITQNGLCGHIFNPNGQQKPNWKDFIQPQYMDGWREPPQVGLIGQNKLN